MTIANAVRRPTQHVDTPTRLAFSAKGEPPRGSTAWVAMLDREADRLIAEADMRAERETGRFRPDMEKVNILKDEAVTAWLMGCDQPERLGFDEWHHHGMHVTTRP